MPPLTAGESCDIYTQPSVTPFTFREQEQLARRLRELDVGTSLHSVSDCTEFQLEPDGRTTSGNYRFTAAGFSQIAQIIAPGLSKLMPDLAGTIRRYENCDHLIDRRMALGLWNELVELRFSLFRPYRVIRNEETRTIEGLVGNKHQFLENLALYQSALEALQQNRPDVSFYAGLLVGRRLAIWFRSQRPFHEIEVDDETWKLYSGYYFTNGEATGMAVRATLAVFTRKGICLGPYKRYGKRVVHTGRDFYRRLGAMFEEVTRAELPRELITEGAGLLLTRSLGFDTARDRGQRRQRTRHLVHALSHLGLSQNLAIEMVQQALNVGRLAGEQNLRPVYQVEDLFASRTLLDLFVPVMRMACQLDLSRREKVEQAAFDILTGKILM